MTITFGTSFRRSNSSDLTDGTFVVVEVSGGYMFCLKGGTEHEVRYAVLGKQGPEIKGEVPGWFEAANVPFDGVYPVDGLHLEFGPSVFQLPVATLSPKNGSIAVDETGTHWLYLKKESSPGVQYVNLTTGEFRPSIGPQRNFFNKWRLLWCETPQCDPQTVASFGY